MNLSQAIDIFLVARTGEGYSPNTLEYYTIFLRRLCGFLDNPELEQITPAMLRDYMAWLQTKYKPQRFSESDKPIAPVTAVSNWAVIRSFFGWANDALKLPRPDLGLKRPRHKKADVKPLSKDEVLGLLDAAEYTKTAHTNGRRAFKMRRPMGRRDRAIILVLLDTGMRVSELCRLTIDDMTQGYLHVIPPNHSSKTVDRLVPISASTQSEIMVYLTERDILGEDEPLFLGKTNEPVNRHSVRRMLQRCGERAGVKDVHPHKFRHTFAIEYLRGGGNPYALPGILGHTSMDMTHYYLQIAQVDLQNFHNAASPVTRWLRVRKR